MLKQQPGKMVPDLDRMYFWLRESQSLYELQLSTSLCPRLSCCGKRMKIEFLCGIIKHPYLRRLCACLRDRLLHYGRIHHMLY
jgi:hypothetical protein